MARARRLLWWARGASRDDRGVSTLVLAMLLPAILGMQALTVDATRTFVERRGLQNAVDSAALAAATYLPTADPMVLNQARWAAIDYAAMNGVSISDADVTFSTDQEPFDRVHVHAQTDVVFAFARTFGLTFGVVGSQSIAQLGQLGGMAGVLPWGIEVPADGFVFGETYCLKLGTGADDCDDHHQGNFHAVDVDDSGNGSANYYRDLIASGSQTTLYVGDERDVTNGNMNGPTQQGLSDRLGTDMDSFLDVVEPLEGGGYRILDWSSPRIGLMPVIEFEGSTVRVLGFAVFFIDTYDSHGAVAGQFVDTAVPGGPWAPLPGGGGGGYGASVARLIQ